MTLPETSYRGREYFPLDPEQIELSLEAIREDPDFTLVDVEAAYLESQNPHLSRLLRIGGENMHPQEQTAYVEATLTVHKLAREAGTPDRTLPVLSLDGKNSLVQILIDAVEASQEVRPRPP